MFGVTAVGAALSPNTGVLIAMRGLQGIGAAMMLPQTLSIITDVFERHERARAIAVWTAVGSVAAGLGPVVGGLLVDNIGWEAVFWLHLPVVAAILVGLLIVPESRDSRQTPMDVPGAILGTGGLLAVVYGIIQGPESGWASAEIITFFAVGVALLAAFGMVEARSSHPMLPVRYLKQRDFIGPAMVVTVLVIAMSGIFFFTTQFLQLVQGRSALMAGVAITPVAVTMMLGAGIAMKGGQSVRPRALSVLGSLIVMGGIAVLAFDPGRLIVRGAGHRAGAFRIRVRHRHADSHGHDNGRGACRRGWNRIIDERYEPGVRIRSGSGNPGLDCYKYLQE